MKKVSFLFLLLCLFAFKSFSQGSHVYPLKAEVKIIKAGYYPYIGMNLNEFQYFDYAFEFGKISNIELTITNISKRTAYLWTMTCSWEAILTFDNEYAEIIGGACDANFETNIEIKPGASKVFKTSLAVTCQPSPTIVRMIGGKKIAATRLGFIVVADIFKKGDYSLFWSKRSFNLYDYANDKKNQKTIIWSNPINLY